MPDEHEKLALYRWLAETRDEGAVDDFTLELADRFGQLPAPAIALVELRRLRVLGRGGKRGGLVDSLKVFHNVSEVTLRRPLKPVEITTVVGALNFRPSSSAAASSACASAAGPRAAAPRARCSPRSQPAAEAAAKADKVRRAAA